MTGDHNTGKNNTEELIAVADQFKPKGTIIDIREYGNGNVNDTFLVTLGIEAGHFILQRINTRVFCRPELVMQNMRAVADHVRQRLQRSPLPAGRRWEVPQVLLTQDNRDHWVDGKGSFWRAISFIGASQSFDTIQDTEQAREVGYALGMFQRLISDLPPERLTDTLEGFHVTPRYLRHLDEVLARHGPTESPEVRQALRFVSERRSWAHVLENARARGRLRLRPIHGDPKVNNVMIDITTHQAVSIVDLDTVKPGLVQYDVGDCLRSCCNPLGEETGQWESVRFDPDLCRAILQGYLSQAGGFLTDDDYDYLYDSIRLISFELGLRFLTDHLEGDVYFKVKNRGQNLARALVQFRLTGSIETQEAVIRTIIKDMR